MSAPLKWILEQWLRYNPFFIYAGRDPLLHQTEIVARAMIARPLRLFIADAIGLGKTIEAIRILATIGRYRKLNYVLIAVPSILIEQWIEELRLSGMRAEVLNRDRFIQFKQQGFIPPGWYVGSIDTLKKWEYRDLLTNVKWDAIVVDEAHRVGVPGREPNERWKFLSELVAKEGGRDSILLLLSATPHRGKAYDYLLRLSLLDPIMLELTGSGDTITKTFDKAEFYSRTCNTIFFRRTKQDVNNVYESERGEPIFKPCEMHAVIVEPSPEQKEYMDLVEFLALNYLNRYYDWYSEVAYEGEVKLKGVVPLLRAVLIKRALSSPESARHTFERIIAKRSLLAKLVEEEGMSLEKAREELVKRYGKQLEEIENYMSGDVTDAETEPDALYDEIAELYATFVDSDEALKKLRRLYELIKGIEEHGEYDRKLEMLKKIIELVVFSDQAPVMDERYKDLFSGKIVVFSEFKDTVRYLEHKLRKWLRERYGDDHILRVLTSENKHELEDIVKWLKTSKRAILIATDVGSEGLNLQYANVLVNYDIAWSPLRLDQRVGRLWRYGQGKTVYVFNLFLAHRFEHKVADVVYQKLFGMTQSVGKIDALLGEKVYYSALRSELLEKVLGEDARLAGLIPLELDEKHKLTEVTIINMIADDAKAFVEYFIKALRKLIEQIKKNNMCAQPPNRRAVEEFLRSLTGFRNHQEAWVVVERIREFLREKSWIAPPKNPEIALESLLARISWLDGSHIYVYQSDSYEVVVLTTGELKVCRRDMCETVYREPIAIVLRESDAISILRGSELLDRLLEVLKSSVPVDEVYGLDQLLNSINKTLERRRAELGAIYHERHIKNAVEHINKLTEYEKKRLALANAENLESYFFTKVHTYVESNYAYIFIPTSLLPTVKTRQSNEVWFWLEDLALNHIVNYERTKGREPVVVKSAEHYDVRSIGAGEERYIEVKAPTSNKIFVALTEREFESAKKYGDRYWLYIVFGADSDKPVILCIRNPVNRLKFVREERIEKQSRYVLEV